MIPKDYACDRCYRTGTKLWIETVWKPKIRFICAECLRTNVVDATRRYCNNDPAIPDLQTGGWYLEISSIPPWGLAWWDALPLKLTGMWINHGSFESWLDQDDWKFKQRHFGSELENHYKLLYVDTERNNMCLVRHISERPL